MKLSKAQDPPRRSKKLLHQLYRYCPEMLRIAVFRPTVVRRADDDPHGEQLETMRDTNPAWLRQYVRCLPAPVTHAFLNDYLTTGGRRGRRRGAAMCELSEESFINRMRHLLSAAEDSCNNLSLEMVNAAIASAPNAPGALIPWHPASFHGWRAARGRMVDPHYFGYLYKKPEYRNKESSVVVAWPSLFACALTADASVPKSDFVLRARRCLGWRGMGEPCDREVAALLPATGHMVAYFTEVLKHLAVADDNIDVFALLLGASGVTDYAALIAVANAHGADDIEQMLHVTDENAYADAHPDAHDCAEYPEYVPEYVPEYDEYVPEYVPDDVSAAADDE